MNLFASSGPRAHGKRHSGPQRGITQAHSAAEAAIRRIAAGIGRCYELVKRRRDGPDTVDVAAPWPQPAPHRDGAA